MVVSTLPVWLCSQLAHQSQSQDTGTLVSKQMGPELFSPKSKRIELCTVRSLKGKLEQGSLAWVGKRHSSYTPGSDFEDAKMWVYSASWKAEAQGCGNHSCVLTPQLTRNQVLVPYTLKLGVLPDTTSLETMLSVSMCMMRSFVSSCLSHITH